MSSPHATSTPGGPGRALPSCAGGLRRALLGLALAATLAAAAGPAAAATPRVSLPAIEREVMCVTCKIPLNLAESPQADRERAFIQTLITRGQSKAQIKRALVDQYGSAVLALPRASGFDLAAYLVPAAALLALVAGLLVLLARWRRREPASVPTRRPPALSEADAAQLDADLARFD